MPTSRTLPPTSRRAALLCGLAIGIGLAAAPNAFADTTTSGWSRTVSYRVIDSVGDTTQIYDSKTDSKTVANGSFNSSVSINQDLSSFEEDAARSETHVKAISGPGKLGVAISGSVAANTPGFSSQSNAAATATVADTLLVQDASDPGATYTYHFRLGLDGNTDIKTLEALSQTYPPRERDYTTADAEVILTVAGTGILNGTSPLPLSRKSMYSLNTSSGSPVAITAPAFIDCAFDIVEGIPIAFFETLSITGFARASDRDDLFHQTGSASYDGNYIHTLSFLPGSYFTDADGNVVEGVKLTAASGFDYLHPQGAAAVPEPASWALMIAGLGLCGLTLRRRHAAAATYAA